MGGRGRRALQRRRVLDNADSPTARLTCQAVGVSRRRRVVAMPNRNAVAMANGSVVAMPTGYFESNASAPCQSAAGGSSS
jgi:hypothetical protein